MRIHNNNDTYKSLSNYSNTRVLRYAEANTLAKILPEIRQRRVECSCSFKPEEGDRATKLRQLKLDTKKCFVVMAVF